MVKARRLRRLLVVEAPPPAYHLYYLNRGRRLDGKSSHEMYLPLACITPRYLGQANSQGATFRRETHELLAERYPEQAGGRESGRGKAKRKVEYGSVSQDVHGEARELTLPSLGLACCQDWSV